MSDQLWVVRAGAEARHTADFLGGWFIAVGFEDFYPGDLADISEETLRARASNPAERTSASQLSAFAYRIDSGDYVIVPLLPKQRSYRVGRMTRPYQHVAPPPASGQHRRLVNWLGEFEREGLSEAAINTLGALHTMCNSKDLVRSAVLFFRVLYRISNRIAADILGLMLRPAIDDEQFENWL